MTTNNTTRTYIGLGSNLENPVWQIQTALQALHQLPDTQFVNASQLYQNPPLNSNGQQPDYINAVAALDTNLSPRSLLAELQKIEAQQGRKRSGLMWGEARTLDLDLLLYGGIEINSPELTVPHIGLTQRNFVLYPLAEIAPNLHLPSGLSVQSLLRQLPSHNLTIICQ